MVMDHGQIFEPLTMGQIPGCHGHGQCLIPLIIDSGYDKWTEIPYIKMANTSITLPIVAYFALFFYKRSHDL